MQGWLAGFSPNQKGSPPCHEAPSPHSLLTGVSGRSGPCGRGGFLPPCPSSWCSKKLARQPCAAGVTKPGQLGGRGPLCHMDSARLHPLRSQSASCGKGLHSLLFLSQPLLTAARWGGGRREPCRSIPHLLALPRTGRH